MNRAAAHLPVGTTLIGSGEAAAWNQATRARRGVDGKLVTFARFPLALALSQFLRVRRADTSRGDGSRRTPAAAALDASSAETRSRAQVLQVPAEEEEARLPAVEPAHEGSAAGARRVGRALPEQLEFQLLRPDGYPVSVRRGLGPRAERRRGAADGVARPRAVVPAPRLLLRRRRGVVLRIALRVGAPRDGVGAPALRLRF